MASALGGILAYGLMQMEGTQGYGGWRWIFIIEGCVCYQCTPGSSMANSLGKLTCGVAFLGYIFLVSFPDNTKSRSIRFLTEEQRQIVIARVNQDRADADLEKFTFKRWLGGAVDWKIWAYGACKHTRYSYPNRQSLPSEPMSERKLQSSYLLTPSPQVSAAQQPSPTLSLTSSP